MAIAAMADLIPIYALGPLSGFSGFYKDHMTLEKISDEGVMGGAGGGNKWIWSKDIKYIYKILNNLRIN